MTEATSTIPKILANTVAARGDAPALAFIRRGQVQWRSWRDVGDAAARLAEEVHAAGIEPGDRVAQVSENRYEWVITDLALHLAGAVHVPIHVTLSGEQIAEQIADCEARLVFVSTQELLAKFRHRIGPDVRILIHDQQHITEKRQPATASPQPPVLDSRPSALDPPLSTLDLPPSTLATILYTSGTTGRPRGVMLSQANLASNARGLDEAFGGDPNELRLCFLPLSHIYARTCDLYAWVCRGSRLALAESRETIMRDIQAVQPHVLNGVPYFYQKVADRVRASAEADAPGTLAKALGGKIRHLCCGGAPLAPEIEAWYAAQGLPILCGYGLTETSPVIAASMPAAHRPGCVGLPLAGVEVRLADDGEVLCRGPNVMQGYWKNEAATREMIEGGWLHTGDLGRWEEGGFLAIEGRKKEIIALATGKKVAPTRVEALLAASPFIEQVAVFGDGRSYLVALVVPAADPLKAEIRRRGIFVWSKWQALRNRRVRAIYADEIERCLAAAAREEQVAQFKLLGRGFSLERGELTPKLSLRRDVIARNFARQIEAMYGRRRTTAEAAL